MANEEQNRAAFRIQAEYCRGMAAPITARVCDAIAQGLDRGTATGRRVLDWSGEPVADGLALRLVGGLHALARSGTEPALATLFAGAGDAVAVVRDVVARRDGELPAWLAGPPQTNEPMRSAALMTGLLHLAARFGPRIELLEIGASAGLNLQLGAYRFDLGGVAAGPADSPLAVVPTWRGSAPPAVPIEIVRARGVDVAPVDLDDPAARERLAAFVWVDAAERKARLARAIGMARASRLVVERGDAADWVEARLAEPQDAGVARVLIHSVVWQYLGGERQARIVAAMERAGAAATQARPLGWVMMERSADLGRQEVRVRGWPGDDGLRLVATAHAHGAWVEGLAPPYPPATLERSGPGTMPGPIAPQ